MIRVLSTKVFHRFARKNGIVPATLCLAVRQVLSGRIDADLGSGLIKQRIARPGKGRSGGFRTIIAFRSQNFACFLYGFAKNDQGNLDSADLSRLQDLAFELLNLSAGKIEKLLAEGNLLEINCHDQTLP